MQTFFDFLSRGRITKLDGVCCDMWQPYIDTIKEKVPRVALVFDKFHIVRRLMDAVDQARCDEMREKGPAHKQLMARSRYVWLKNPWNLTDKQDI